MAKNFHLKSPRLITIVRCYCYADPKLFSPWDKLSIAQEREFEKNGPIPCEGGGWAGEWCRECRFGEVDEPEEE